ncbi:MAG: DsbE family thiol:disulfide interchange protein [Gammaproteobacteria bacterium]|nr:DsbE family thiol:disulfide interchange protein [Gammaproteobacteria bacterium]
MMRFKLPLAIFILMVGLLAYGLGLDPKKVPSPLIDKPAPAFSLASLHAPQQQISNKDLLGEVWVLNVWASWCVACRAEHEFVTRLARMELVKVIGLNYKDRSVDAKGWLQQWGDPYSASLMDTDGRIGIDWGVYGVPETFIVDKNGLIKYKFIGPINQGTLDSEIVPLLRELLS